MSKQYPDKVVSDLGEEIEITLKRMYSSDMVKRIDAQIMQAGAFDGEDGPHTDPDDGCCGVKPGGRCCGSKNENATGDDI
jgi:hypothetical protein